MLSARTSTSIRTSTGRWLQLQLGLILIALLNMRVSALSLIQRSAFSGTCRRFPLRLNMAKRKTSVRFNKPMQPIAPSSSSLSPSQPLAPASNSNSNSNVDIALRIREADARKRGLDTSIDAAGALSSWAER